MGRRNSFSAFSVSAGLLTEYSIEDDLFPHPFLTATHHNHGESHEPEEYIFLNSEGIFEGKWM